MADCALWGLPCGAARAVRYPVRGSRMTTKLVGIVAQEVRTTGVKGDTSTGTVGAGGDEGLLGIRKVRY
jgi:hypothetical protein